MTVRHGKKKKFKLLRKIREMVDDVAFANGSYVKGSWNFNAVIWAIREKLTEYLRYLLSVDEVRKQCVAENKTLHGILTELNKYWDEKNCTILIRQLTITEKKLNEVQSVKQFDSKRILSVIRK